MAVIGWWSSLQLAVGLGSQTRTQDVGLELELEAYAFVGATLETAFQKYQGRSCTSFSVSQDVEEWDDDPFRAGEGAAQRALVYEVPQDTLPVSLHQTRQC